MNLQLKDWKCVYACMLSFYSNEYCEQPDMWFTGAEMIPAWNIISRFRVLFSATFFLPPWVFTHIKSIQVGIRVCLMSSSEVYSSERTGYTEHEGKLWNWAGMVAMNNVEGWLPGFMVWDPAPNPPPSGPSSFLLCTVVYTWATMNHICWKKRGRTMKQ